MSVEPFDLRIASSTLQDLQARLALTRLPPDDHTTDWDAGTSPATCAA